MAEPIVITCDACKKKLKVPATAAGKKVRCKNCQAVIPVPLPEPETAPAGRGAYDFEKEAADAKNPYGVTYASDSPRCPHCANDIEPPDAVICLVCGYDLVQRGRVKRTVVYERTAGDFLTYQGPTLLVFLLIIGIGVGFWYYHWELPNVVLGAENGAKLLKDRWGYFDGDVPDWSGIMFHWGIELWLIVFGLAIIWKCLKFMYQRLFVQFLPVEREKKK